MENLNEALREITSDEKIIELFFQRSEEAIVRTDNKYGRMLFGIAYNILYDENDSEECKSDTYLKAWNSIPPTRPKILPAFMASITRHIAIDRYKERRRKKRIPSEFTVSIEELYSEIASNEKVEESLEAKELARLINNYVKGLSDTDRYIFVGRYYMADPVEKIAKELGVGISAVYKALGRIRKGLKCELVRSGVIL